MPRQHYRHRRGGHGYREPTPFCKFNQRKKERTAVRHLKANYAGYGTTRPLEQVLASCGLLTSAELELVAADDVPNGGSLRVAGSFG